MQHPVNALNTALDRERGRLERGAKHRIAMAVLVQNTVGLGSMIDAAITMAAQARDIRQQLLAPTGDEALLSSLTHLPPAPQCNAQRD